MLLLDPEANELLSAALYVCSLIEWNLLYCKEALEGALKLQLVLWQPTPNWKARKEERAIATSLKE